MIDECRFNAWGEELHRGQRVWCRRLTWAAVRGTQVQEAYGVYSGYEGSADSVQLRSARAAYRCRDCGHRIEKEDLHGSNFYTHVCLDCVTAQRPLPEFHE